MQSLAYVVSMSLHYYHRKRSCQPCLLVNMRSVCASLTPRPMVVIFWSGNETECAPAYKASYATYSSCGVLEELDLGSLEVMNTLSVCEAVG